MRDRRAFFQQAATWIVLAVIGGAMLLFLIPPAREAVFGSFKPANRDQEQSGPHAAELIHDDQGHAGLRLTRAAMDNLEVAPTPVTPAHELRALPPQMGTVNYDNDYLFSIRPRFAGEMVSFAQVTENPYPNGPELKRDLSFGDTVKQGQVLGVFWSKELGVAKAALVDAIIAKTLSEDLYRRHLELFNKGALPEAAFLQTEKQLRTDLNSFNSALQPLYVWKLPREEIQQVEQEARTILRDLKKPRNPEEEIKRWARVEIRAPVFARDRDGNPDPTRELTVVEKNVTANEFVDPGRDMPLFRLADLSRLQVWIHPPEEYLPLLRGHLNRSGSGLRVLGRFQADAAAQEPVELKVTRLAPSIDPGLRTPMLIAELRNPERTHLIGQFVNTIIYVPPLPDTVEVPTTAINIVDGQYIVFVRPRDGKDDEFYRRRIAVAQSAGTMTLVRSKLTEATLAGVRNENDKGAKRLPLEPLEPGEVVLTRGVVELTAALDDLLSSPGKKE